MNIVANIAMTNQEFDATILSCKTSGRLIELYLFHNTMIEGFKFLADRTNGRAYATVLRLSSVVCPSVTLCIVAKRCVLEQKLLLRAYRKSYVRNRLVSK